MEKIYVKDMMIPLDEYATIRDDQRLFDAVIALEDARTKFDHNREKHKAVLVLDESGRVVGKLSQFDIIRALEPKYDRIANFDRLSHWGLNVSFIRSIVQEHGLWKDTLENLCLAASSVHVRDIMYTPREDEFVAEDAVLDEAMHQLVMGRHQALLVTRDHNPEGQVTGILRLYDVFHRVCGMIMTCRLPEE